MTNSYDIDTLWSLTIKSLHADFYVEVSNDRYKYWSAEEKELNLERMATYPVHIVGTPAHLTWETVATFPVGNFLENIVVRANWHSTRFKHACRRDFLSRPEC
jgi:hypothetical protein